MKTSTRAALIAAVVPVLLWGSAAQAQNRVAFRSRRVVQVLRAADSTAAQQAADRPAVAQAIAHEHPAASGEREADVSIESPLPPVQPSVEASAELPLEATTAPYGAFQEPSWNCCANAWDGYCAERMHAGCGLFGCGLWCRLSGHPCDDCARAGCHGGRPWFVFDLSWLFRCRSNSRGGACGKCVCHDCQGQSNTEPALSNDAAPPAQRRTPQAQPTSPPRNSIPAKIGGKPRSRLL